MILAALLIAPPAAARAIEPAGPPDDESASPSPYDSYSFAVPVGLDVGFLGHDGDRAGIVGGELSLVWFERGRGLFNAPADGSNAFGVVASGVWVSQPSHLRASLGAEAMHFLGEAMMVGVEGAVTLHSRGEPVGFRARGCVSWYWPLFYVGLDYHERAGVEVGALLKIPIVP